MRCEVINEIGEFDVGGLAEFDIVKGHYIHIDVLCTNKKPFNNKEYTHDGAATILLNILKKYVDFEKKEYPSFYLHLESARDSREYYLRQNLQTSDNDEFTYGENTKTLRKVLSPTQKELLLLRGDDDGTKAEKHTTESSEMKSPRKSKRLNPKKKYDYTITLYIDKNDFEKSLEVSDEKTDGNLFEECVLL